MRDFPVTYVMRPRAGWFLGSTVGTTKYLSQCWLWTSTAVLATKVMEKVLGNNPDKNIRPRLLRTARSMLCSLVDSLTGFQVEDGGTNYYRLTVIEPGNLTDLGPFYTPSDVGSGARNNPDLHSTERNAYVFILPDYDCGSTPISGVVTQLLQPSPSKL